MDTLAAVAISTSRLGGKTFFADENKLKPLRRDPFAPYEKKAPPVRKVVKEAESPQVEPLPPAESWTLTAAMSDPSSEGDTLLFKKGSGSMKYALTLKKGGDITLSWSGEKVEIKIGEKQMLWTLGETVSEEDIPKKLVEAIKNNVLLKSENAPVPEASVSTAVQENASSEDGLSEEELGKMGITKEMVKQLPTEQLRMFRGRRNR